MLLKQIVKRVSDSSVVYRHSVFLMNIRLSSQEGRGSCNNKQRKTKDRELYLNCVYSLSKQTLILPHIFTYSIIGSETEEPLKKRPRISRDGKAKPGKPKGPSSAKTKTQKNLIPNLEIELLEKDPVFGEPNDIPLISVKWGIKSVLLDDMKELKRLHKDTVNIYTVHWARSPHLSYGPVHYALLMENKEALKILHDLEDRDDVKAEIPKTDLEEISTGRFVSPSFFSPIFNSLPFYTFFVLPL